MKKQMKRKLDGMKKNHMICGGVGILILGVCLLLIMSKRADGGMEESAPVSADVDAEVDIGTGTETEIETEAGTDASEAEEVDYVYYLVDEEVRNHPLFNAFVNKKITAYDDAYGENRYIQEYFAEYPIVFGVHYMAEDLEGDGEEELLVLVQWEDTGGDLLVFHESGGKLYAWEAWKDFLIMQMSDIEYHGNGIFSKGGGAGYILGRYNAEGKIEYMMEYYAWSDNLHMKEEGGLRIGGMMTLYEEGIAVKEYEYEGLYYRDDDSWKMTAEDQVNKDACDAALNEVIERLGRGKLLGGIEWDEDVKRITLDELLSGNKGTEGTF